MMSPTTVAELLPQDSQLFDIVVIDEASQMLPCDALGAIARGRQAVIVGDPKQLPPSTYFQGSSAASMEEGDDEQMLAQMVESILDLSLSAWHPPRRLHWHYRSRHSSLIQFSNMRFYDNRLIVFPGPTRTGKATVYAITMLRTVSPRKGSTASRANASSVRPARSWETPRTGTSALPLSR